MLNSKNGKSSKNLEILVALIGIVLAAVVVYAMFSTQEYSRSPNGAGPAGSSSDLRSLMNDGSYSKPLGDVM